MRVSKLGGPSLCHADINNNDNDKYILTAKNESKLNFFFKNFFTIQFPPGLEALRAFLK